jgi:GTP pyrophosphokinase
MDEATPGIEAQIAAERAERVATLLPQHKKQVDDLCARLEGKISKAGIALVRRAGYFTAEQFIHHKRFSGAPYFVHFQGSAELIFDAGIYDGIALAAAYLHDWIEDKRRKDTRDIACQVLTVAFEEEIRLGKVKREEIERVVDIVETLTMRDTWASFYLMPKLVWGSRQDIRAMIVRLAERLNNQEDWKAMWDCVCKRKSREVRQFHAPLAEMLGLWEWRCRLYDTVLRDLEHDLRRQLSIQWHQLTKKLEVTMVAMEEELRGLISGYKVRVIRTPRCLWDIRRARSSPEVETTDLLSFSVVVDSENRGELQTILDKIAGRFTLIPESLVNTIDTPPKTAVIGFPLSYRALFADFDTEAGLMRIQVATERSYENAMHGMAEESRRNLLWYTRGTAFVRAFFEAVRKRGLTDERMIEIFSEVALNTTISPWGEVLPVPETTKPRGRLRRLLDWLS